MGLQEYDFHHEKADYRGTGQEETFADAMLAAGFSGIFFKDPLVTRSPPSGVAIYWRAATFAVQGTEAGKAACTVLDCSSEAFNGAAVNVDLDEHWHAKKSGGDKVKMNDADRRNAGLVKLVTAAASSDPAHAAPTRVRSPSVQPHL